MEIPKSYFQGEQERDIPGPPTQRPLEVVLTDYDYEIILDHQESAPLVILPHIDIAVASISQDFEESPNNISYLCKLARAFHKRHGWINEEHIAFIINYWGT
jgi:hypothetical protein